MADRNQNDIGSDMDSQIPRNPSVAVTVPDSDKAMLNHILRMTDAASNFQSIVNPVQAPPLQRDHFLEVQHIVDIVLGRYGTVWYNLAQGLFIDLATFVSEHRNLFAINDNLNQQKKLIPWANYPNDPLIRNYFTFQTNENRTVEQSVRALVNDMANRQSNFSELTRYVGQQIKAKFGW
ncbi:hypothetical protein E1B28_003108 [Marasmius oreades]|uniref:Uncharacterized protein n=1 Tax=Marasmius oreades TaxID=181124 RepID=A0A9P7RLR2_9AGAR|nr:uncharacterized protein E1B28_003108 [Marasmius oreades]KAG7085551.1 hypothetical protein E1B28_003108 [Marasmius oreades]